MTFRGFRIQGLSPEPFRALFDRDDAALAAMGARRRIANEKPGFPCRVSLEDAEIGEEVLLLNYEHHPADSPYRASGPVYVRKSATESYAGAPGEIPAMLRSRLLSLRAYDARGMMRTADVCDGAALEETIAHLFEDPRVSYLHVHNAKPGCFDCRVERV